MQKRYFYGFYCLLILSLSVFSFAQEVPQIPAQKKIKALPKDTRAIQTPQAQREFLDIEIVKEETGVYRRPRGGGNWEGPFHEIIIGQPFTYEVRVCVRNNSTRGLNVDASTELILPSGRHINISHSMSYFDVGVKRDAGGHFPLEEADINRPGIITLMSDIEIPEVGVVEPNMNNNRYNLKIYVRQ